MKKGFTLAEVLITLVILGVVAAMTIPVVTGTTRDAEYKSKAKKVFSVLTQAMAFASLQGYPPVHTTKDMETENIIEWFDKYLEPNLTLIKKCTDSSPLPQGYESVGGCWGGQTKGLNGNIPYCSYKNSFGAGVVQGVLNDGTFINIDSYGSDSMAKYFGQDISTSGIVVFFDVNGSKKPNVLGRDIYVAVFQDGTLVPAYVSRSIEEAQAECSKKNSGHDTQGNGYACLKVVMEEALQ